MSDSGGQEPAPRARLAYTHGGAIWTIDATGSSPRRVTRGRDAAEPAWSPDGTLIAFSRAVGDERAEIWVAAPDGGGARMLVKDPSGALTSPAWSSDGSQLAFARYEIGKRAIVSTIEVVARDGSALRVVKRLRATRALDSIAAPVWTPGDGGLLYTQVDARPQLYHVSIRSLRIDGTGDRGFLDNAEGGVFSPDGQRFAYGDTSAHTGETCGEDECYPNGDLALASADSSGRRLLMRTSADESDPTWSGDGTRIAFSSGRNTPEQAGSQYPEVYSVAPDGSCLTWLTNGNVASGMPSWSPDATDATPSACGSAGRKPLIERRPAPRQASALWLGPNVHGALFSGSGGRGRGAYMDYSDCAVFAPRRCPQLFSLAESDACTAGFALRYGFRRLRGVRRVGRALFARREGDDRPYILLGRSAVLVDADGRAAARRRLYRRVAAALRPASGSRLPGLAMDPRLRAELPRRFRRSIATCGRRR